MDSKKILLAVLVISLLASTSFALGIRPAKSEIDYLPGESITGSFRVVNKNSAQETVRVYVEGEAKKHVVIHDRESTSSSTSL